MLCDHTPFRRGLDDLSFVGTSLERPECVLATASGHLFTCDWRGVIARTAPDGRETVFGAADLPARGIRSNGIAMRPDGSFLFANVGCEGGVWSLARDGQLAPFLREVDGVSLPSTNFTWIDAEGRVWVCVSTRNAASHDPAHRFSRTQDDGFIVMVDARGARIVADGLVWTNECRINPAGSYLYVNETFGRRLTRFPFRPDGTLGARETVVEFGEGTWPDGLAFDQEGGCWVTSIISNRVVRIAPDGEQALVLEDCDPEQVTEVEAFYERGELTREVIASVRQRTLINLASLAFGGPDLRTVYLGSLGGRTIPSFRSPLPGLPPAHWHVPS